MSTMLLLELFIFYAMDGCGAVSNTAAKQRSGKGRSLIVLFMQSFHLNEVTVGLWEMGKIVFIRPSDNNFEQFRTLRHYSS